MNVRTSAAAPLSVLILAALLASPPARAKDICPGSPVPPGGAACRFTLWSSEGCFVQLAPDGPDCRALEKISSVFVKLRAAAGFSGDDQLKHLCATIDWPETPLASYTAWNRCVNVNVAFLRRHGGDDAAIEYAIAHEVSHGIQDHRGEMAWPAEVAEDESEAGKKEFERRRRILEAQADVLSIQLLERAGFPVYAARKGFEACNGPAFITGTNIEGDHPSARSRWLNMSHAASLMTSAASERKLQETMRKYGGLGQAKELSRLFEGAGHPPESGVAAEGGSRITPNASITPIFYKEDFTDEGDIRLNRVSERLRREPPPPVLPPTR